MTISCRPNLHAISLAYGLAVLLISPLVAQAANDDEPVGNEYRLTSFPYYRITDKFTGFGYLGYVTNPDEHYQVDYLGAGGYYLLNPSVQLWGGLISTYTDNERSADKLELRPFTGVKLFLPNIIKWNIYNFTRYEFRDIQNQDTYDWTGIHRLRSRFGVEFPLTSLEKAWQPKSWYGLVDVEPMFRFDNDTVDPFRARGGIGYIMSSRIILEFTYTAQFTPAAGGGLAFSDNIFRLNIKIALDKGIVGRMIRGGDAD